MAEREPEVVRHEEQLRSVRVRRPSAVVRVRRTVVTEERTVTVQVRREELTIETVPLAGDDRVGLESTEHPPEGYTFDLYEEEVELRTRVVPRERVRLFVDREVEEHDVDLVLAHEEVEVEELSPPTTA